MNQYASVMHVRALGWSTCSALGDGPCQRPPLNHLLHRQTTVGRAPPRRKIVATQTLKFHPCFRIWQQSTREAPASDRQVCGHAKRSLRFLGAGSRRGLPVWGGGPRHPLRRVGRPNPESPSLCRPSWLVRRSKRLCGSGRVERYALLGTWLKCPRSRDQGSLVRRVVSSCR